MLVIRSLSVLTPSVVCFILWAIQTPNRPPTLSYLSILKKICGRGEVYLTISCHKIRTDVRTKLNFPCCALEFIQCLLIWISVAEQKRACLSACLSGVLALSFCRCISLHFVPFDKTTMIFSFSFPSFSLCVLNLLT